MSAAAASDYGEQFASFYDQLYPREPSIDDAVAFLAARHRPQDGPPLELGVGTGRIARPLAERVGTVVGVDSSPEMLAALAAAGGDVVGVHGDMRDYSASSGHGLVFCVLGSLSVLLGRAEQEAAVLAFAAAAAPGACVVIETKNPGFIRRLHDGRATDTRLVPYAAPDTALLSQMTLDEASGRWHVGHVFFDSGRARIASETALLIEPEQLDAMAARAGLELEVRHATWAGAPVGDGEPMVVSAYRRPAR